MSQSSVVQIQVWEVKITRKSGVRVLAMRDWGGTIALHRMKIARVVPLPQAAHVVVYLIGAGVTVALHVPVIVYGGGKWSAQSVPAKTRSNYELKF